MKVGIISFTQKGRLLSDKIKDLLQQEHNVESCCLVGRSENPQLPGLAQIVEGYFQKDVCIFVGACGIAVRAIAPFLQDKTKDPAVLVLDEKGEFVIPILSGHIGGANSFGSRLSTLLKSQLVLTTATDVNGKFAVDVFAKENQLLLRDFKEAKRFSAALLQGEASGIVITNQLMDSWKKPPFDNTIVLYSKNLYLGVGCRKGKEEEALLQFAEQVLAKQGLLKECIAGVASIDLKRHEPAVLAFAQWGAELQFYTAQELLKAEGDFCASPFVEQITGVDNVCQRSAYLASNQGKCLLAKEKKEGMTLAIYEKEMKLKGLPEDISVVIR